MGNLSTFQANGLTFRQSNTREYVLDTYVSSFNGSIDIDILIGELISTGTIGALDRLSQVVINQTVSEGVGDTYISNSLTEPVYCLQSSGDQLTLSPGKTMSLLILTTNTSRLDYFNLSQPMNSTLLNQSLLDFYQQ